MNRLIFSCAVLILLAPSHSAGLEPLPAESDAAFLAGAHAVIGCESCHWEEPDRIPRSRIPTVCGDCHPGPLKDYETSVHWDSGVAHTVCTDCHGLHGILPVANPQSRAHRSLVCGKCHPGPMEELAAGPHRKAFDRTGAWVCASCHDNHAVRHPTVALIAPACQKCHAQNSSAFAFGLRVSSQFQDLRERSAGADRVIEGAAAQGYETKQAVQTLSAAQGRFTQARLVWHSLNQERLDEQIDQAAGLFDRSLALIQERMDIQKTRETGIAVVWVVILLGVVALHLKRKSLETEDKV